MGPSGLAAIPSPPATNGIRAAVRRLVERVRAAPARLGPILDERPEPLIALDSTRRILAANEPAERLFGFGRHELEGRRADELVPERARGPAVPPTIATEHVVSLDLPGLRQGGVELELEWTFGMARRPEGPVFLVALEDIHDQRRADEQRDQRVEAILHDSEERFHKLVDAVSDYAIFMLDALGHVRTWNPGVRRIKGYESDEILGKHFSIFYTPEDRAADRPATILDTVRREGRFEEESWRVRKDGSRFWANVVITALRDPSGAITGFAKVTRDLTARRQAEENERALALERTARASAEGERKRLLGLIGKLPAIVNVLVGPDLIVDFVHPKATVALGGREIEGKPLVEGIPEFARQPEILARMRSVLETGRPSFLHEQPVLLVNGGVETLTYWESVYLPIFDARGGVEGVLTFDLDVTSPVVARREMERINRAKDEFLATMSHELRTPLNAIRGWAAILRRKPRSEEQLDRGLEVIERNARMQTRLVDDLFDISRIVSGKLELKLRLVAVFPIVMAAVDVLRPAAEGKGIRLAVDVDPEVGEALVDAERLQQVVWNLLSNAIRFTPKGGSVHVSGSREGSALVVRVEDTGVGIAAEHLPHVFERFMQVDSSTTRAHGGLGLGLSIVKYLVEAHGGSVEAESPGPGKGATFVVRLPIRAVTSRGDEAALVDDRPSSEPVPQAPQTAPARLDGLRVLVVDDDPDSLELLRTVLTSAGAQVTTASSAREAFERLDEGSPFDAIVSDIGMPEIDGYSFIRGVRSRPDRAEVPAMALTAYARPADVALAIEAGYQEHLAKPVNERRLVESLRAWSSRRRS